MFTAMFRIIEIKDMNMLKEVWLNSLISEDQLFMLWHFKFKIKFSHVSRKGEEFPIRTQPAVSGDLRKWLAYV